MGKALKPGQGSGNQGGIYQEHTPAGGKLPHYVTVPEHRPMPPTEKPGNVWVPIARTPKGHK